MRAEPFFEEVLVWDFKEGGYDTHHVYGFVVTQKGTVLAFSEGREKAKDDNGPKDQMLKRSTDGGRTWGKDIYIERKEGAYWNANGHPGVKENWTNYSDLAVLEDKTILLLYAKGTGFDQQKVVCIRFNVEWLTDSKDSLVAKPVHIENNQSAPQDY